MFVKHKPIESAPQGHEFERAFGSNLAATFTRPQLLTLQYAKLINYFSDDLDPEWGGDFYLAANTPTIESGMRRYLENVGAFDSDVAAKWIHKRHEEMPWGPDNFKLRDEPAPELGAPYEAYLAINGAILTMNQASRILCVDAAVLVSVKLRLIFDEKVVAEAITRMLRPRPDWPRIEAKQGRRGQTMRFKP